ncbi:Fur family transcriptional regulator [Aliiruegeria lutimaris]|uniref:Fur family transcriptional regulator, zinc uptake regulator n=1 Tax=Aliiruegeria lutimaris TaxID=571298 RepID=A0A1G9L2X4_9RHOB|nr:Fur family transcriptional regulator [Aliiruegeria lutimaris]SDL55945.1 Fur family transcriptional regulator, zinc uptake regulator [Aliiruegeria lutimaris]
MSSSADPEETLGFVRHDHARCVATAIRAAERHCADAGLRFTAVRRRALEILLEEHKAMGAYEVLERLQSEGLGAQPPAAYRALDFLVANGFAHRIERLNAFVACSLPGENHVPAFLICRNCRKVAETTALPSAGIPEIVAGATGFRIERMLIEAEGCCADCQEEREP